MSDMEPSPETVTIDIARAIEALAQAQALIAGRLYAELVETGQLTGAIAAERLEVLATDLEDMAIEGAGVLRLIGKPMRDYANQLRPGGRLRLSIVKTDPD